MVYLSLATGSVPIRFIFLSRKEKEFFYSLYSHRSKMYFKKNTKNNHLAAVLVLTIAITTTAALATTTTSLSSLPITSSIAIPAAATPTTGNATNTATTTTITTVSQPELSPQPVLQEQVRLESQTPVNNTHFGVVVSGSGTLTLPNGTEPIQVTSTKTGIVSLIDGAFSGKEVLTTEEDGSESATATFYEITRFNMESGEGRGIAIATFHTNSTGVLAPLNGMILTGIDELYPDQTGRQTLWEWQSGIPLPPPTTGQEPPLTDTTTTTTTAERGEGETVEEEAVGGAAVAE